MRRPPRPPTPDQLDRTRADLHKAVDTVTARWTTIARHANDWQTGYPPGNTEGPSPHHVTDPMAEHLSGLLSPPDWDTKSEMPIRRIADPAKEATEWLITLAGLSFENGLGGIIGTLLDLATKAIELDPKQPELKREETIGQCECCEHDVARTIADTLKAGLCPKCYASWTAAQRRNKDRHTWLHQRRLLLATRGLHALDEPAAG